VIVSALKRFLFHFPHEGDRLFTVQNEIIYFSLLLSFSVIGQALVDFVLETMSLLGLIDPIPFRLEFLFLTLLSGILGFFTLSGIRKRHIDLTRSSLITSICLEVSLVASDVYYLSRINEFGQYYERIRLPFIILTSINILLILVIIWQSKVFSNQQEYVHSLEIIEL
jgi:hypothetical protein